MKKPSRKKLLGVIGELQHLIGTANAAYGDDRDPNRADKVHGTLERAFNLCVEARSADPPESSQEEERPPRRPVRCCSVVDSMECLSPPEVPDGGKVRPCWGCGDDVCVKCSSKRMVSVHLKAARRRGRSEFVHRWVRMCYRCQEERGIREEPAPIVQGG